ncbi:DUF4157 domain-containing protein [Bradyrhizobium ontarionense]|uniref:DUF4157 domain-containing protein n=1 Tax=Bradyrhizobium ontarionense TaxID=2898149 RepID=A0ABY3RCM2_9BRAD|nr:DUF4157 domain-containing protein [Bradyrhizobium sp. A19]UFZ05155.1 DUF4157 domain-containing protein [Bradyrhizobium sp. A19]
MSAQRAMAVKAAPVARAARPVTLQRTCACEETGETCSRCAGKRTSLQRFGTGAPPLGLPDAVSDVLRSPGQPMPRTRMEEKFGKDFSAVRIHADASAQSSAARPIGRDDLVAAIRTEMIKEGRVA